MHAIEALRRYTPGCEGARLRNFGMTIGIRDTRKIDAVYNMTEDDVRERGAVRRLDRDLPRVHRRLRHPDPADDRPLLPAAVPRPGAEGRPQPARRRPLVGGDRVSHASTRNMSCCAVLGQGAGIAAALSITDGCELDASTSGRPGGARPAGRALPLSFELGQQQRRHGRERLDRLA